MIFQISSATSYFLYRVPSYEIFYCNLIRWHSDWAQVYQPTKETTHSKNRPLLLTNQNNQRTNFHIRENPTTSTRNNPLYTGVHVIEMQRLGEAHEWLTTPVFHINLNNGVTVAAKYRPDMKRVADLQSEKRDQASLNAWVAFIEHYTLHLVPISTRIK